MSFSLKRVDKLVALSVLGSVIGVWLVLTGFDAVTQFVRQLTNIGKNGFTLTDATVYVLVTTPRRAYEMFGNAALIGSLLGLGGLAATSELTALRASGMSRLRIAVSATGVIAALIVGVVILGETAAPWGDQLGNAMQLRLKANNIGSTGSGMWARDGDHIINARGGAVAIRSGDHDTVQLINVRVFTLTKDGQLSRFDWAKTADHDGHSWVLHDVRSTTLDDSGVHSHTAASEQWHSSLNPQVLAQSAIQPQYLSMRDLRRNMHYLEANGESPGVYAVEFWTRALYALNVLVLVLCAMPFAFGTMRSGGLGKRIFIGNFGTVYGIPPLIANLLPAALLAVAAWLHFRKHA
jgi:lipopolysaccharide export system permease protein